MAAADSRSVNRGAPVTANRFWHRNIQDRQLSINSCIHPLPDGEEFKKASGQSHTWYCKVQPSINKRVIAVSIVFVT